MIKYISIDALLNFVPLTLQEEVSATQIKSWAYQLFKQSNLDWKYNLVGEIIEINNHKAVIPTDALDIKHVAHVIDYDLLDTIINIDYANLIDDTDKRVIIAQQQLLQSNLYQALAPLKYIGSNKSFHGLDYCNDCVIGFSIDKQLACITIDVEEGHLFIMYKTLVKDGDILIPDDPTLMMAMSHYAQAMYWQEKAMRNDRLANQMYLQNLNTAQILFTKAKSLELFRNYSVDAHESLIKDRFIYQKLSVVSGLNRNKNVR